MQEPAALAAALAASTAAARFWRGTAPSSRKGNLWWIAEARADVTRDRRIAETVRLAALGLQVNFPESRGR